MSKSWHLYMCLKSDRDSMLNQTVLVLVLLSLLNINHFFCYFRFVEVGWQEVPNLIYIDNLQNVLPTNVKY